MQKVKKRLKEKMKLKIHGKMLVKLLSGMNIFAKLRQLLQTQKHSFITWKHWAINRDGKFKNHM